MSLDYDISNSVSKNYFEETYGNLMFYQIKQIAEQIIKWFGFKPLTRDEKRTRPALYKWYDDYFYILKPILDNIVIEDENHCFYGTLKEQFVVKKANA